MIYGNNDQYYNYYQDKNPLAFFGFESLSDFIDYVRQIPDYVKNGNGERSIGFENSQSNWFGTSSMNTAMSIANNGWYEGLQKADEISKFIAIDHAESKKRNYDVAGGKVNVGKMLTGNPKHMLRKIKKPSSRNITLFVQSSMTNGITVQNAIIRASLICAMVDILENKGFSIELIAAINAQTTSGKTGFQGAITLKNSGEKMNLSDVAFSLGHPSFFRRMIFGAVGSSVECKILWSYMGSMKSCFQKNKPEKKNDFYIPQLNPSFQNQVNQQKKYEDKCKKMFELIKPDGLPIEFGVS